MREPIIQFKSKEQFEECLRWWKDVLFLNNWVIKWNYIDYDKEPLNSKLIGHSDCDYVNQCAVITLADYDTLPKDCIMTLCDEKVLVHELLHIKYPTYTKDSFEAFYMEMEEHAKLEQMAKTLIMVKYDLPFDWFDRDYNKEEHSYEETGEPEPQNVTVCKGVHSVGEETAKQPHSQPEKDQESGDLGHGREEV